MTNIGGGILFGSGKGIGGIEAGLKQD